jgi:hypothetical protein
MFGMFSGAVIVLNSGALNWPLSTPTETGGAMARSFSTPQESGVKEMTLQGTLSE